MVKCPYCSKEVDEDELYCDFCEEDISKTVEKERKPNCFIATAAYGSGSVEEVMILRNFRDTRLRNNFFGEIFISFYYKISPGIANYIKNKKFLKIIVRKSLNPIVRLIKK